VAEAASGKPVTKGLPDFQRRNTGDFCPSTVSMGHIIGNQLQITYWQSGNAVHIAKNLIK